MKNVRKEQQQKSIFTWGDNTYYITKSGKHKRVKIGESNRNAVDISLEEYCKIRTCWKSVMG